jgi:hypothetical protein
VLEYKMTEYRAPYKWSIPNDFPNKAILNYRWQERKTDSLIFMQGRSLPFDTGNPNMAITLQDPKDYDLIFHSEVPEETILKYDVLPNNSMGGVIVKSGLLKLMNDFCPNDFQAFPVIIRNENPKLPDFENHDYWLINITNMVDAIDREATEFNYLSKDLGGEIFGVKRNLNFREKVVGTHHLSRDSILHSFILASPELVSLFKKEKIKGVRFLKDFEAYP